MCNHLSQPDANRRPHPGTQPPTATTGIFRQVMTAIQKNSEHLPSLPTACTRVRKAMANPHTTVQHLTAVINRDPALTAFIMKAGASPIYHNQQEVPTLDQVVRLLGYGTINNLTLLHSMKSLFINQDKRLKPLCKHTWRVLALKAGLASLVAKKLDYKPPDKAMVAAINTELGSLAILSALSTVANVPDLTGFNALCRSYGTSLSSLILKKWQSDPEFIAAQKQLANWQHTEAGPVTLGDVVNLAHYHALTLLPSGAKLPDLTTLAVYQKLPAPLQRLNSQGLLAEVMAEKATLASLANTFL